jgi:hypothetical protein
MGKIICYPEVWLWPPFSPDLNPLHFSIWSVLETRELAITHKSFAVLHASICRVWAPRAEELARNASRLSPAAWSRSSPQAAVSLHLTVAGIINKNYHHFSRLPNHQFKNFLT